MALLLVLAGGSRAAVASPLRMADVAGAQAAADAAGRGYAAALTDLESAEERFREESAVAVAFESELRRLDQTSLDKVLAYEESLSKARNLAVDAYVRGGSQSELDNYFDAEEATDVILRMHLLVGRVDQAREAAQELQTQRRIVDAVAEEVAGELAAAADRLVAADAALEQARAAEQDAYAALLAATDELSRVVAQAQADEAARAAAEAAAAAAEAARRVAPPPAPADGGSWPTGDDGQADAWEKLRQCESGGNYRAVSANGLYRGAYQFAWATWAGVGGVGDPAAASPAEQDYRALLLYQRSGRGQWPVCGRFLA